MSSKPGPKPLPKDRQRTHKIKVSVRRDERATINANAERAGVSVSAYLRAKGLAS